MTEVDWMQKAILKRLEEADRPLSFERVMDALPITVVLPDLLEYAHNTLDMLMFMRFVEQTRDEDGNALYSLSILQRLASI